MNSWENILEAASYIDNGIKAFEKVISSEFYVPLNEPEYENQIPKMNEAIKELGEEVYMVLESKRKVSSLQKLLRDTERCCQEVIKYGILCDLPISLAQNQQATHLHNQIPAYIPETTYQKTPARQYSPSSSINRTQNKTPTIPVTSGFREISQEEFDKLSVKNRYSNKFNDLCTLYKTLFDTFEGEFSLDDVSRVTRLFNTRITSLIESLLFLKRIEQHRNSYIFI